jgi:hypothetical protein
MNAKNFESKQTQGYSTFIDVYATLRMPREIEESNLLLYVDELIVTNNLTECSSNVFNIL